MGARQGEKIILDQVKLIDMSVPTRDSELNTLESRYYTSQSGSVWLSETMAH